MNKTTFFVAQGLIFVAAALIIYLSLLTEKPFESPNGGTNGRLYDLDTALSPDDLRQEFIAVRNDPNANYFIYKASYTVEGDPAITYTGSRYGKSLFVVDARKGRWHPRPLLIFPVVEVSIQDYNSLDSHNCKRLKVTLENGETILF